MFKLIWAAIDISCRSDVTKYEVLKESFDQIVRDFGRIDGL